MVGCIPGLVNLVGRNFLIGPRSLVDSMFIAMYLSPNLMLNPSISIVDLVTSYLTILPVVALSRLGKSETTSFPMMQSL